MRNLLNLLSRSQQDLNARMKSIQWASNKRKELASTAHEDPETKVNIKLDDRDYDSQKYFLERLKQYNVDPEWLHNQQFSILNKELEREEKLIMQQVAEVENSLIVKET
jgi:hypothetical protein